MIKETKWFFRRSTRGWNEKFFRNTQSRNILIGYSVDREKSNGKHWNCVSDVIFIVFSYFSFSRTDSRVIKRSSSLFGVWMENLVSEKTRVNIAGIIPHPERIIFSDTWVQAICEHNSIRWVDKSVYLIDRNLVNNYAKWKFAIHSARYRRIQLKIDTNRIKIEAARSGKSIAVDHDTPRNHITLL